MKRTKPTLKKSRSVEEIQADIDTHNEFLVALQDELEATKKRNFVAIMEQAQKTGKLDAVMKLVYGDQE